MNGRMPTGIRKQRNVGIILMGTGVAMQPLGSLLINRSFPMTQSKLDAKKLGTCISAELTMMLDCFLSYLQIAILIFPAMFFIGWYS